MKMTTTTPGQGPDWATAARAVDQAELSDAVGKAVGVDLAGQEQQAPYSPPTPEQVHKMLTPNRKAFNDYSQGLAGKLIAEQDVLRRARSDIARQMADAHTVREDAITLASKNRDDAIRAADAAYAAAEESADDALEIQRRDLDDKEADAMRSLSGIDAALKALTAG